MAFTQTSDCLARPGGEQAERVAVPEGSVGEGLGVHLRQPLSAPNPEGPRSYIEYMQKFQGKDVGAFGPR